MRRPLPLLALGGALSALACSALPQTTCGPGTQLQDKTCVPAYPQVTCGPGTSLSGTTCILAPEPDVIPDQERMISDLHGQSVTVPQGPSGLSAWTFSLPSELHAIVVENKTEAGDVLQLDTRTQLEDYNTRARYTVWMALVYRRVSSSWRFESTTVAYAVHGWVDARPPETPLMNANPEPAQRPNAARLPGARPANGRRPGDR